MYLEFWLALVEEMLEVGANRQKNRLWWYLGPSKTLVYYSIVYSKLIYIKVSLEEYSSQYRFLIQRTGLILTFDDNFLNVKRILH